MKILSRTFAACILAAAIGAPALAQTATDAAMPATTVVGTQDGQTTQQQVTDPAMMEAMMKNAKAVPANTMMMIHDGKMYTVADRKMPGGQMMSAMMAGTAPASMPTSDGMMKPAMNKKCCGAKPPMARSGMGMGMGMGGMAKPPAGTATPDAAPTDPAQHN